MNWRLKVRLPKWQHLSIGSWSKELLMTFIGTTLSIVLTFGTAQYLEQKQQRADGRQTAMLVIHDIEKSADCFEQYTKNEEEHLKLTRYTLEHLDKIQEIRWDTLNAVLGYLMNANRDLYRYDDSNEKLFLSSQDVWKNINSAAFIDVVQQFFYLRRKTYLFLNSSSAFERPITQAETTQFVLEQQSIQFDFATFLSNHLKRPDVISYITGGSQRIQDLNRYMMLFREYAKRCKFLMEISDEELNTFIVERQHTGHPLKEKQLIGAWMIRDDLIEKEEIEFNKDHTYTTVIITYATHPYFVGRVEVKTTQTGTWQIKGDSLCIETKAEFEYAIDRSHITYMPDKEKDVNKLIADWDKGYHEAQEEAKNEEAYYQSWAAAIDSHGNKIELRTTDTEADSEDYSYLTRKNTTFQP